MDADAVRERASAVPSEPGVYQFQADDVTLYVGKALDLRSRVRSYADPRSERIRRMIRRADAIDVAVTDTETQALLLEANLIKRHQPRYNVRLKDDKSYPLVQFTAHEFPRIEVTRDPDPDAVVYGPFTERGRVDAVVKAIRETLGLRGCSDHKYAGRSRPCLDHDIGLCAAPCTDEISVDAYADGVRRARRFFEGETGVLADPLESKMTAAVDGHAYERAARLRDRLSIVESFHGGGGAAVIGRDERAVDVLGASIEGETAIVARLHSEAGKLVDRDQHRLTAPDCENRVARVLSAFIPQYYAERQLPDAILLPERPDDPDVEAWLEREGVAVRVPGAGREATLVNLALKNAHRSGHARDEAGALADALGTTHISRIEGFDVSHAHGTAVVGSNVVFDDGRPETAGYRRKKLDETNDDYANMRTLIRWRATRAVEGRDDRPDPDLLLVDGGKGQLRAAMDALDEAGWSIPVVSLAKRDELVVTPDGVQRWEDNAPHLHLLQRVRDEAHRFAVQYHQTLRDDVATVLDDVEGVGPTLRGRLLRRFGSVDGVRAASTAELRDVHGVGAALAERLSRL